MDIWFFIRRGTVSTLVQSKGSILAMCFALQRYGPLLSMKCGYALKAKILMDFLAQVEETVGHLKIYKGHLYYVISRRIERITLNGVGRTIVVNGTTTEVGGLEIEDDLIYWSEAERIFVANLLGINMKILGGSNLGGPKALAVMGRQVHKSVIWLPLQCFQYTLMVFLARRFVYWVDTGGGLERMDKWTGLERSRIVPRTENLTSILHVDLQTVFILALRPFFMVCAKWHLNPNFLYSNSKTTAMETVKSVSGRNALARLVKSWHRTGNPA